MDYSLVKKFSIVGSLSALTLIVGAATLPQLTSAQTAPMQQQHRERHPELRAALRALETARADLQKGAHDYNGKRVEALNDTKQAIAAVKQAIANDQH